MTRLSHKKITSQSAPIFVQFIGNKLCVFVVILCEDCVWQIQHQYPAAFEFNERLLIKILKSLYSCEYGTFLMDSESERYLADIPKRTVSLWAAINSKQSSFKNSLYKSSGKSI